MVAGTLCGGKPQGSFVAKMQNCMSCDFYNEVKKEEGAGFKMSKDLLDLLK